MNLFVITYGNYSIGRLTALSLVDLMLSFLWVLVVLGILFLYKNSRKEPEYKYFIPFFLFKMFSVLLYVCVYVYYYKGGDSVAFWHGGNAFIELATKDFSGFLRQLFQYHFEFAGNEFTKNGIAFPGWIFREYEGYFVAKVSTLFCLLSGKQFLLTSLYFSLFTSIAQWRLYRLLKTYYITSKKSGFDILFLFIPSVAFWCSGATKDAIILYGTLSLIYHLIKWVYLKQRKFSSIIWILFYSSLMFITREVIFAIIISSFILAWIFTAVNSIEQRFMRAITRIFVAATGLFILIVGIYVSNIYATIDAYLEEGFIIQQDFAQNYTYTGERYSLGVSNFSISSLLLASPLALFTGIFRPGLWESFSVTLFLNGLESSLLLYLFFKKIVFNLGSFIRVIFDRKILLLALMVVLTYAFVTGLTSIIFGVLVRLRAPLLLFFAIVLYWRDFRDKPLMTGEEKQEALPEAE